MSKSLLYSLIALLIFWIILGAFLCCKYLGGVPAAAGDEDTTIRHVEKAAAVWSVSDGNKYNMGADRTIDFVQSNYKYLPLSAGLIGLVDSTASYMRRSTNRSINITGKYTKDETNSSILPTIGLARANQIKQLLIQKGVDAKRILTGDLLVNNALASGDTLFSGVKIDFTGYTLTEDTRLADIKNSLVGKPILLYFQTGKNEVNLSADQRQLFADLIYYLDNVTESSISVNGYTDSVGSITDNTALSQERANFIKTYLISNGIVDTKMTAKGFGPANPIADNNRTAGRAQNRRVEVLLN